MLLLFQSTIRAIKNALFEQIIEVSAYNRFPVHVTNIIVNKFRHSDRPYIVILLWLTYYFTFIILYFTYLINYLYLSMFTLPKIWTLIFVIRIDIFYYWVVEMFCWFNSFVFRVFALQKNHSKPIQSHKTYLWTNGFPCKVRKVRYLRKVKSSKSL